MRIAIMGTGAVGGFFGAKLAAASNDVAFIGRGAHLAAMRREGLTVESPQGNLHIDQALFTDDPTHIGEVDLILFCVKSYDTEPTARSLRPMISDTTIILSLQNGIDNADKIKQLWPDALTLAGVVYIGAQLSRPGLIKHSTGGKIVFGGLDGSVQERTRAVEQVFSSAQILCELSRDIRQVQWRKLLWNAPFCAISCLTHATVKDIVESDSLTKLALDCMREVREAAKIQGIHLSNDLFDETFAFSRALGDFKPSMLQDLEAGKPLEFEAFNGIVVDLLKQAGKQTPINQVFNAALQHIDRRVRMRKSL
jgi:2-dehydropantoate 2-reductase